jgi:DNA invertase Pin-like site-specific DNA recombinase
VANAKVNGLLKYQVVAEFTDAEVSGDVAPNEKDRPGLWAAIHMIKSGEARRLVVTCPDRLARSVLLAELIHREVEAAGGVIEYMSGGREDTAEGRLLRQILQSVAEFERALIRSRTSAAMTRLKRANRCIYRAANVPYGWRLRVEPDCDCKKPAGCKVCRRIEPDPAEAAVIARALALHTEGKTPRQVCDVLRAEGFRYRSRRFYPCHISKEILNRALAGAAAEKIEKDSCLWCHCLSLYKYFYYKYKKTLYLFNLFLLN